MSRAEIKEKVDHALYKELSNAQQRDVACRKTEAIWSNARINDFVDHENGNLDLLICKAKAEMERSILDLIIQRDSR